MTSTAIELAERGSTLEPKTIGEAKALAVDAAKTRFFPGLVTPEAALLVMVTGKDLGLSAAQSLRAFHVIEGRPTLSADGMVAVCLRRSDVCEYFRTAESTPQACTVETKRRGEPGPRSLTFTLGDAARAGLTGKGNWGKYPAAMLRARARAALARDVYPDLLLGLYDPDELGAETPAPVRVELEAVPVPVETTAPALSQVSEAEQVSARLQDQIAAAHAADPRMAAARRKHKPAPSTPLATATPPPDEPDPWGIAPAGQVKVVTCRRCGASCVVGETHECPAAELSARAKLEARRAENIGVDVACVTCGTLCRVGEPCPKCTAIVPSTVCHRCGCKAVAEDKCGKCGALRGEALLAWFLDQALAAQDVDRVVELAKRAHDARRPLGTERLGKVKNFLRARSEELRQDEHVAAIANEQPPPGAGDAWEGPAPEAP